MSLSIVLACLWGLAVMAAVLSPERYHRAAAWILIVTGVPLVGFVTLQNGPLTGLLALAAGFMMLSLPGPVFGRLHGRTRFFARGEE